MPLNPAQERAPAAISDDGGQSPFSKEDFFGKIPDCYRNDRSMPLRWNHDTGFESCHPRRERCRPDHTESLWQEQNNNEQAFPIGKGTLGTLQVPRSWPPMAQCAGTFSHALQNTGKMLFKSASGIHVYIFLMKESVLRMHSLFREDCGSISTDIAIRNPL